MSDVAWSILTRDRSKQRLYEREPYFREGLADAAQQWGDDLASTLYRSALLMVKPDGLQIGNTLSSMLEFLDSSGFRILGARWVRFDRFMLRELWRYQLTSASLDRFLVADAWCTIGPGLLLVIRRMTDTDVPATVDLAGRKGSATLSQQEPGTIRHLLGQPNRMLSLVHVADEPADLLRELSVLVDRPTRLDLLQQLRDGSMLPPADAAIIDDGLRTPQRSTDVLAAVERTASTVGDRPDVPPGVAHGIEAMRAGRLIPWRPFADGLRALGVELEPWDLVLMGTNSIEVDEPGSSKLLVNPKPGIWSGSRAPLEDIHRVDEAARALEATVRSMDPVALHAPSAVQARSRAEVVDEVIRRAGAEIAAVADVVAPTGGAPACDPVAAAGALDAVDRAAELAETRLALLAAWASVPVGSWSHVIDAPGETVRLADRVRDRWIDYEIAQVDLGCGRTTVDWPSDLVTAVLEQRRRRGPGPA